MVVFLRQEAFEKCWAHSPLQAVLHCHSPGVATVARRLRIDVHDNYNDDNDNVWQRGPLWPHRMGPIKRPLEACSRFLHVMWCDVCVCVCVLRRAVSSTRCVWWRDSGATCRRTSGRNTSAEQLAGDRCLETTRHFTVQRMSSASDSSHDFGAIKIRMHACCLTCTRTRRAQISLKGRSHHSVSPGARLGVLQGERVMGVESKNAEAPPPILVHLTAAY